MGADTAYPHGPVVLREGGVAGFPAGISGPLPKISGLNSHRGNFLPLFLFAPLTAPANPDVWEPLATVPNYLLVISIERHLDAKILKALAQAEATLGPATVVSPSGPVSIDHAQPIAEVYRQMADAGLQAAYRTLIDKDDASFFFLRGYEAVVAFNGELIKVTGSKT